MKKRRRVSGFAIYYWALIAALFTPLVILVVFAFNDSTIFTFPLSGFTTKWVRAVLQDQALLSALRTSTILALVTSLAATVLGTLGAAAVAWYKFPGKKVFLGMAVLPLVFPAVLIGVAMLIFFHMLGITLSIWTVGIGELVLCWPVAMLIMFAQFAGMSRSLEHASMDLGATYLKTQLLVTVPIAAPSMFAAFFTCFVMTFNEFALAFFVSGTQTILPVYLFSMLRQIENAPVIVAAAAMIIIGSVTAIGLAMSFRVPFQGQRSSTRRG